MIFGKFEISTQAFTVASATKAIGSNAKELRLSATQDCWVRFDDTAATNTNGVFIQAGIQQTFPLLYVANISVIRDSVDGTLSILELYG